MLLALHCTTSCLSTRLSDWRLNSTKQRTQYQGITEGSEPQPQRSASLHRPSWIWLKRIMSLIQKRFAPWTLASERPAREGTAPQQSTPCSPVAAPVPAPEALAQAAADPPLGSGQLPRWGPYRWLRNPCRPAGQKVVRRGRIPETGKLGTADETTDTYCGWFS